MNDIKGRPVVIKEQDIEQELDVLNGIGLDEYFCPFYVSTSTVRPIYITLVNGDSGLGIPSLYWIRFADERQARTEKEKRY